MHTLAILFSLFFLYLEPLITFRFKICTSVFKQKISVIEIIEICCSTYNIKIFKNRYVLFCHETFHVISSHTMFFCSLNFFFFFNYFPLPDSVCLMCYVANGHILAFSLPSLRPLFDADFLPLTDYR